MIEPKIEQRGAFLVAGMRYEGKNEHGEIPAMWGEFIPRAAELEPDESKRRVFYGVCRCLGPDAGGAFEYLAALERDSIESLPEGMVGWEIPEQTYAVTEAHGLSDLSAALGRFYNEWLPSSEEYTGADGPMFELYPETFDSIEATLYLYFPVRRK